MPPALVNDPKFASQAAAAQVDANKNSPAPKHSMLYEKGLAVMGNPTVTTVAPDGTVSRKPAEVKPWALGLALALDVLSGAMAGGSQKNATDAFQAGQAKAQQQRAAVQQANQEQDATAKADQNHKLAITEANMRLYQTGVTAAKTSLEASQAFGDNLKVITDPLLDGTIQLPPNASMERKSMDDTAASVANGQTNITKDILFAVGDAQPSRDRNGKQIVIDGKPQTKHDYLIIHGVGPDGKIPLTKEMQDEFNEYGVKHIPAAGIGEPMWSFADIAKSLAQVSSLKNGEMILQMHHDDAHDMLPDHEAQDIDIAKAVKDKPEWNKAVDLLAQAQHSLPGANTHIEDILNVVGQKSASAQGLLMNYLGLKAKDLDTLHNQRVTAATAATAEGKAEAVNPDTMGKALALMNNPTSTKEQKAQAQGVIDGFNKQEKLKADNAADAAQAKEDYKQQLKDQRTMGYVEDQKGDVYHVSQWQAEHMPNYSAQTFIEKKPSDISADQKAIKPINDIQNNINGYRAANNAYDTAAKANKVNVAGDRSNLTTIFSAPAITDAAAAHAGAEGFGITIPTLAASLNKSLAEKVLGAYNALSPEGKTMADSYARMRGAIPAYVKVITNAGRGSKEQLDIELQNIMPPYFNQSDIRNRTEMFQGNLDTQKAGFPKNLAGSHFVEKSGGPSAQTHNFSLSAWQKANPTGDANAAKAAAQKQGLTVVQ